MERRRAWLIVSQSRQENVSRTVSITVHRRRVVSSVCVTPSPSLRTRFPPQHAQAVGRIDHPALARQMIELRSAVGG